MSKFATNSRLNLDTIGDGWQGCFIEITKIGLPELGVLALIDGLQEDGDTTGQIKAAEGIYEASKKLLKDHFVAGQGFTGERDENQKPILAEITAEDATTELYSDLFPIFIKFVVNRGVDPNLLKAFAQQ